ncbi:hypothetical protein RHMOL_Rhmol08G0259200 [Rhododendron molle]|uniref:Uncharacterized protein n=1 Tax=Rhododendron molle TaxID=49168 RepID=A0ACC0MTZ7_RHOML|nr:hypothetical protein RHMOL_Rhmol08G0259200 [Rhododendron molle]
MAESDAGEGGSNSRRPTHGQRELQKDGLFLLMLMPAAKLPIFRSPCISWSSIVSGLTCSLLQYVRMLVYEYVINGNLEQWLQEAVHQYGYLTWEARIKVLLGTVNARASRVRDIKLTNILIDDNFNVKISGFGLAKLLGAGNG